MNAELFWSRVKRGADDECWEWTMSTCAGYGQLNINNKHLLAHRIAYELAIGDTNGLCVLHHCDNRKCCNPAHLFLGTRTDNMHDMIRKRRSPCIGVGGEAHHNAKLTRHRVDLIRQLAAFHLFTNRTIAALFMVSDATVSMVVSRKSWAT